MSYLEFDFKINPLQPARDILIAELSQLDFESFVENDDGLLAYIQKAHFTSNTLENLRILKNPEYKIVCLQKEIEQQNWNAEWERNFKPITIGEECMVRAPFHPEEKVKYDLVIEPKMSFGTGHHETTHMMLQHLLNTDLQKKNVLDMGCGTGVLAILAEKLGAAAIDAIDIDDWCYENTLENVSRNGCEHISVFKGDSSLLGRKKYDVVLANINKNILLTDIPTFVKSMNKDGHLFLSGFYNSDFESIDKTCQSMGLTFVNRLEKNEWVATLYRFS